MHQALKGLLFDFDGTLLDSFAAHFAAYRHMFARFDISLTKEQLLATYSPNWYETYRLLGLPQAVWEQADAYWVEAAAQQTAHLFPGVKETLTQLHGRFALGLVTSGSKPRVLADLERTGIAALFQVVVTGDDVEAPKPDPEGLIQALRALALQPHEIVYVGDAPADYEMARALDVAFVGVPSAFARLHESQPFPRVPSVTALPSWLGIA